MIDKVTNEKSKIKRLKKCLSDSKFDLNKNSETSFQGNEKDTNVMRCENYEEKQSFVELSKQIEAINSHLKSLEKTFQNELKKIYKVLKSMLKPKNEKDVQENLKEQNKTQETKKCLNTDVGEIGQNSPFSSLNHNKNNESPSSKNKIKKIVQSPPRKQKKNQQSKKSVKQTQINIALQKYNTFLKKKQEKAKNSNKNILNLRQTINPSQTPLLEESQELRLNRIRSEEKFNFKYLKEKEKPQNNKKQEQIVCPLKTDSKKIMYLSPKQLYENNLFKPQDHEKKKQQTLSKQSKDKIIYLTNHPSSVIKKNDQQNFSPNEMTKNHEQFITLSVTTKNEKNKKLYMQSNEYSC